MYATHVSPAACGGFGECNYDPRLSQEKSKCKSCTLNSRHNSITIVLASLLSLAEIITTVTGAGADELDWSDWRAMPVVDGGRRMPLDTFARETVRAVCGRTDPKLDFGGKTKKFSAAELLFSWLVEAEKWNDTAFLRAGNERLREKILDVPLRGDSGKQLRYVSPLRLDESAAFDRYLSALAAEQQKAADDGLPFTLSGESEAAAELNEAYGVYRTVGFDPRRPAITRTRFFSCLGNVLRTWRGELAPGLQPWLELKQQDRLAEIAQRVSESMQDLVALYHEDNFSLEKAEKPVNGLCQAAAELNAHFIETRDHAFDATSDNKEMLAQARAMMNKLAANTKELARQSDALRRSLFDNGRSLRVVPALDPWALRRDRDPSRQAQPWPHPQRQQWRADRGFLHKEIRHKVGSGIDGNDNNDEQTTVVPPAGHAWDHFRRRK